MSNDCLKTILDRRSVLHFKDDDVPQDVLDQVLMAAVRAPSPGGSLTTGYRGMQAFSVIVVRGRERRAALNELLCDGKKQCIEEAPVSLVFCVDLHRINRWAELQGGVPHFRGIGVLWVALRGTYAAAQNAVIAAYSLGLGAQYIQEILWQPYETLQYFKLPKRVLPVAMLTVGYPAELPELAPALPLEAVVHEETYRNPDDATLLKYFGEKEEFFQKWLESLPKDSKQRQSIEARGVTNLAQYVSLMTYTDSFYRWRDDVVRSNLAMSDLE
ncbi:MAG: nitroreductase family protein [Candidatus Eisenbacteria bacterium]